MITIDHVNSIGEENCDAKDKTAEVKIAKALVDGQFRTGESYSEAYCLAVVGGWGSGKTHFVNRVCSELANSNTLNSNIAVHVMRFEPWAYLTLESLMSGFLFSLSNELDDFAETIKEPEDGLNESCSIESADAEADEENDAGFSEKTQQSSCSGSIEGKTSRKDTLRNAANGIRTLLSLVTVASTIVRFAAPDLSDAMENISAISGGVGAISEVVSSIADEKSDDSSKDCGVGLDAGKGSDLRGRQHQPTNYCKCTVDETKRKICDDLRSLDNTRIVIVVDNIDRLDSDSIVLLFRMIAAIADFPNVSYLLSFDSEVVCRALDSVQGLSGRGLSYGDGYLEKVVNAWFRLPEQNVPRLVSSTINGIWDSEDSSSNEFLSGITILAYNARGALRLADRFDSEKALGNGTRIVNKGDDADLLTECAIRQALPRFYEELVNKNLFKRTLEASKRIGEFDFSANEISLHERRSEVSSDETRNISMNLRGSKRTPSATNGESAEREHADQENPRAILKDSLELISESLGIDKATCGTAAELICALSGDLSELWRVLSRGASRDYRIAISAYAACVCLWGRLHAASESSPLEDGAVRKEPGKRKVDSDSDDLLAHDAILDESTSENCDNYAEGVASGYEILAEALEALKFGDSKKEKEAQ